MSKPKARKDRSVDVLGVAWYRESDWPRVKTEFSDADELHDTYAEWHELAEFVIRHLKQNGVAVEPFVIDLDHFIVWCISHDQPLDAEARSAYVTEMLELRSQGTQSVSESSSG